MLDEGFRGFLLCLRQLAGAFGGFADLSFESAEEQLDLIQQFLGVGELTRVVDAVVVEVFHEGLDLRGSLGEIVGELLDEELHSW